MANVYLETMEINTKAVAKRKKNILSDLDNFDDVSLPSSLLGSSKKEKKKEKQKEDDDCDKLDPGWLDTLTEFKVPKTKGKSKNLFDGFDIGGKKKKKKKKDNGTVNHKKDFEPELVILRNLQMDQNKFVDSLQKKYDQMEGTKSTARGVGKYTTDLVNSISTARSVSMQLVDKIISVKKTIADLDFKERKEFGSGNSSEQQNLTNYASTYLKQVMTAGRNNVVNSQTTYFDENDNNSDDIDDLFSSIDESLGDTDRSDDVDKYLKYEKDNVQIKVIWDDAKEDDDVRNKYEFVAYKQNGDIIDDYPLPEKTKLNINRATEKATDIYGNKYDLIVVN